MRFWDDRVLHIDGEAIVIDKPAGLAVHPGARTRESLEDYLHHLRFGFRRLPQPVHRLDRDTSGCLLLARNPKAHKAFQRAFEEKRVEKAYVAVLGAPTRSASMRPRASACRSRATPSTAGAGGRCCSMRCR